MTSAVPGVKGREHRAEKSAGGLLWGRKKLKQETERKSDLLRKVCYAGGFDRRLGLNEDTSGSKTSVCKCPVVRATESWSHRCSLL